MAKASTCDRIGCLHQATHGLRFVIKAAGCEVEVTADAALFVCGAHAMPADADVIFRSEPGRRQIEAAFFLYGKAAPDWPRCRAEWFAIPFDRTAH